MSIITVKEAMNPNKWQPWERYILTDEEKIFFDVEIPGDLNIIDRNVIHISTGIRIAGNLVVSNSILPPLPDDLWIQGNLIIKQSKFYTLDNIYVGGYTLLA